MPLGINKDFKPGLYISVCLDMVALVLPPEGHPIVTMAICGIVIVHYGCSIYDLVVHRRQVALMSQASRST
jgi:hypothetical protein